MDSSADAQAVSRALRRVGTSLCGRYRIRWLVGMGGMAAVYAGLHRNGHEVAIKILHEGLAADSEIRRLFRREAQLANDVGHPGVVPVIDDDVTEDGCVFLVMPLLEGETLRARAARFGQRLPVEEVILVASAALEALAAAHAKKIVHRDVKPENLFLTCAGDVRILDFGIGRFFEANDAASATRSGRAVGTPAFMAPEQALGRQREVDGRTDLWALGATMFSLLAGRYVHEAESATEVAVLAATKPARLLREVEPEVAASLGAVVDRALAFRKDQRWGGADEMRAALAEACVAALGRSIAALPRIAAPRIRPSGEVSDAPTRAPSAAVRSPGARLEDPITPVEFRGTTTGSVVAQPESVRRVTVHPRRRLPAYLAIGGVALAAVAAAAVGSSPGLRSTLMSTGAVKPEAVSTLSAAEQLWRDASLEEALKRIDQATTIDPSFAQANLRYTLFDGVTPLAREHFHQAAQFRERLSPHERELLGALEPSLREPSDVLETRRRLEALARSSPDEIDLLLAIASRYLTAWNGARALEYADRAIRRTREPLPVASLYRARALAKLGRFDEARVEYDRCLDTSPSATACLVYRALIDANDGRCESTERLGRRIEAIDHTNRFGPQLLAGALFAETQSVAAARAALEPWWASLSGPEGEWLRQRDETYLHVLVGDFDEAERSLSAWERAATGFSDADHHGEPAVFRVLMDLELGKTHEVDGLVHGYLDESRAWSQGQRTVFDIEAYRALYRANAISKADFDTFRAGWLELADASWRGLFDPLLFKWYEAYVEPVRDADDARLALEKIPPALVTYDHEIMQAQANERFGVMYALAGRDEDARPYLRRSATACTIERPIHQTMGILSYGDVLARAGDTANACAEYAQVVRRWGKDARSVTAAAARRDEAAYHCPSPEDVPASSRDH